MFFRTSHARKSSGFQSGEQTAPSVGLRTTIFLFSLPICVLLGNKIIFSPTIFLLHLLALSLSLSTRVLSEFIEKGKRKKISRIGVRPRGVCFSSNFASKGAGTRTRTNRPLVPQTRRLSRLPYEIRIPVTLLFLLASTHTMDYTKPRIG